MKTVKTLLITLFAIALAIPAAMAKSKNESSNTLVLSKDNTITLFGEVKGDSVAKVISAARKMDSTLKSGYPIVLVLDTPGGSIQSGLELIEALKALNRPVHTLTIFAASMGFQIAQHLNQRNILSYGVLMSHKAFGGFQGEFGGDGLSQLDSRYGFWLRRIKQMDEQTVKRTKGKQTLKSYRTAYENELWISGDESVEQGYADEVVEARCDSSLNGQRSESVSFFGMNITLKFSECPLNTYPEEIVVNVNTNKGRMVLDDFLAKGGVFGECPKVENDNYFQRYDRYDNFSNSTPTHQPIDKTPLCVTDKALTMEKINQTKEEIVNQYTQAGKRSAVKAAKL